MKRAVYRVKPPLDGKRYGWRIVCPGGSGDWYTRETKRAAVSQARTWARKRWENTGQTAQLVVHNRNGRLAFEHTYGRDPERRRG